MAAIRSYTTIEQSKKLTEILPLESADMVYRTLPGIKDNMPNQYIAAVPDVMSFASDIPCWSLASLLNVLPVIIGDVLSKNALRLRMDKSERDFTVWYENLDSGMVEEGLDIIKSNAVDACYEIIIELHKLKML